MLPKMLRFLFICEIPPSNASIFLCKICLRDLIFSFLVCCSLHRMHEACLANVITGEEAYRLCNNAANETQWRTKAENVHSKVHIFLIDAELSNEAISSWIASSRRISKCEALAVHMRNRFSQDKHKQNTFFVTSRFSVLRCDGKRR